MQCVWKGSVELVGDKTLEDIALCSSRENVPVYLPPDASLNFLSVVDTSKIPLHIVLGGRYSVATESVESRHWFQHVLFAEQSGDQLSSRELCWWDSARPDSPLGILLSVSRESNESNAISLKATELLIFASRDTPMNQGRLPTPPRSSPAPVIDDELQSDASRFGIFAIPLSSDLLHVQPGNDVTPPASPAQNTDHIDGVFIPSIFDSAETAEVINHPPVRKRKTVTDTLDAATERLRKARRKGGEGVAAAAATSAKHEVALPTLKHRRSISNTPSVPLQTRPLSRASSVTSARPASAMEHSVPVLSKRSSLSRVKSVPIIPEHSEGDIESKNKDLVSRIVMAGMRLYGLSPSKTRKSHASSTAASPVADMDIADIDAQRRSDEEYKLVYHQTYKGTCFAFRNHFTNQSLTPHTAAVRETVDQILAIYCTDPLIPVVGFDEEKLTPGGRRAFGHAI